MCEYYVYIIKVEETNQILYVGKGKGNRIYYHLRYVANHSVLSPKSKINTHLFYKCKKLLKEGFTIIEQKLYKNLTEKDALYIEEELIFSIGIDNLCNYSPEGSLNTPPKGTKTYDEYVQKMSAISKERWSNPEYKKKMVEIRKAQGLRQCGEHHPNYNKKYSKERLMRMSKIQKGKKHSPEQTEKIRQKLLGRQITWKDKIGASNKKTWTKKIEEGYTVPQETRDKISKAQTGISVKVIDQFIVDRIIELYKEYGPNRIRKTLQLEGVDISLFLIRRVLVDRGVYEKYRKRPGTPKRLSIKVNKTTINETLNV